VASLTLPLVTQTNGRIAALLELGSGFNPEFTGRENVYMNAAVLGLSGEEIDMRFDEIAAFADIGNFIEQPVKTYSSGMLVRLAFAVAINVDPEILVVDEALSVGDELFQRKCFSRIEAMRANGSTIIFVSHSGSTIVDLCDRAVLIGAGEKLAVGLPKKMVGHYQRLIYAPADQRSVIRNEIRRISEQFQFNINLLEDILDENQILVERAQALQESFDPNLKSTAMEYVSHGAYIASPAILTLGGKQVNNLIRGTTYRYTYTVRFTEGVSNVRFGMLIKTVAGFELGGATSGKHNAERLEIVEKGGSVLVEFRFVCLLGPGMYFLNAGVAGTIDDEDKYLHRVVDARCFRVMDDHAQYSTGIVDFSCTPEIMLN
jgi:lipopolysaccharide transport system ATP-binding protein